LLGRFRENRWRFRFEGREGSRTQIFNLPVTGRTIRDKKVCAGILVSHYEAAEIEHLTFIHGKSGEWTLETIVVPALDGIDCVDSRNEDGPACMYRVFGRG
jgi:hypothetical protein